MSLLKPVTAPTKKKNNDLVYQHNELIEATYKMSVGTKRLFLMLLSEVDPLKNNANLKTQITIEDFALTCGIDQSVAVRQLWVAAKDLNQTQIETHDPIKKIRTAYTLTNSSEYHYGLGFVKCDLNPKILPLIQLFKGNFTSFKLAESIKFKRFYTIRLYELLMAKDNDINKQQLTISVSELRVIFKIKYLKTYQNFAKLNEVILKPSIKEIQNKTDIQIFVELERRGRRIDKINFSFKRDPQMTIFQGINKDSISKPYSKKNKINKAINALAKSKKNA